MKNLLVVCFLFSGLSISMAQSGSLDGFFKKYQADESFTVVNISPKMFSIISGMDIEDMDPEVKEILDNMTGLKIMTKESEGTKYFIEAMGVMKKNGLEELMTKKEKGQKIEIFGKSDGKEYLSEVVMIRGSESSFVLMQVLGKLSIAQLTKLSSTLNN